MDGVARSSKWAERGARSRLNVADGRAVSFVWAGRPPSGNKNVGAGGRKAQAELGAAFRQAGGRLRTEPLYGIVYYIVQGYRPTVHADADNVAKRVWDALEGSAYADDQIVRLRIAGIVDTLEGSEGSISLVDLDLSTMDQETESTLVGLLGAGERHVLYVEIGPVGPEMFRFSLAGGGEDDENRA